MKGSTLIGILIGVAAIITAFLWEGGVVETLFMLPAMLIVFGGTFAAGLAGSSFNMILRIPTLIKTAFFPKKYNIDYTINQIVSMGGVARRDGILALELRIPEVQHPYLKKLLQLCVDGADPQTLVQIAEMDIHHVTQRHNANINLFMKMGGYSPTMGIIGTVLGLISTLSAAGSEPQVLIHHIASAFIATMWGIFLANVILLPLGDKLRSLHNEEMAFYSIILQGVHAVQLGETPSVIRARLLAAFPINEQSKLRNSNKFRFFTKSVNINNNKKSSQPAVIEK